MLLHLALLKHKRNHSSGFGRSEHSHRLGHECENLRFWSLHYDELLDADDGTGIAKSQKNCIAFGTTSDQMAGD